MKTFFISFLLFTQSVFGASSGTIAETLQRSVQITHGAALYLTGRQTETYEYQGNVSRIDLYETYMHIWSDYGGRCSIKISNLGEYTPEAIIDLSSQRGILECIGSGLPHSGTDQIQFTRVDK